MSGHTPGPWAIVHQDALLVEDGHVAQVGNQYEVRPQPGVLIGDEAADLALVAAAPDLLEALQNLLQAHHNREVYPGFASAKNYLVATQLAREAIVKATQTRS